VSHRRRIASGLIAALVLVTSATAPVAAGASSRKPVRFSKTIMKLIGFAVSPGTNPLIGAELRAQPRKRGCISNREVDVRVISPAGDRVVARIFVPRVGKDASAIVGASFPLAQGDTGFYLDTPAKRAGRTNCGGARSAIIPVPLPP
jgi:hypothetical protein